MLYITDVQQLVSHWLERLETETQPQAYRDALSDCIYDLHSLVDKALMEELDYKEMLEEQYADSYLSSSEAHERVA